MKYCSLALVTFLLHSSVYAGTFIRNIKKAGDGFYLMYYDTSAVKRTISKSAIVAFKNYIVLLEMPIVYDNSDLTDHTAGGEDVMQALKTYFPDKPLKYIISSHWHPHSISSVMPFITQGVTLITTRNNFKKISEFVDSATYQKYRNYIQFVEGDSMIIKDKSNCIILYKCNQSEYTYVPTEDFLYSYIPKYKCMQTSCMYQRFSRTKVRGKELVSGRSENLYDFVQSKKLSPQYYLCTEVYDDDENGMIAADTLGAMIRNGIGMMSLENELLNISEETLVKKNDSLLSEFAAHPIPLSIINSAVYTALKKQAFNKARALAKLQALLNPSDPNSWDTYGETYYFSGDLKMAKRFELASKRIDKNYSNGGEQIWKEDLEDYKKKWSK